MTHEHGDHHFGLRHFPQARWLAAPPVAEALNGSGAYQRPVEAVAGTLLGEIEIVPTPGHTMSHHSLAFTCEGQRVVIAADAVMTRDFFRERRGYFNSADFEAAGASIERVAEIADVVVPGHDNYFLVHRTV